MVARFHGKKDTEKNRNNKAVMVWLVIMAVFIAELLLYTWCRVQYVRIGYEISNATKSHSNLLTLRRNLKIELAHLKSPERIEKIAKQQLGLITPTPKQILTIP